MEERPKILIADDSAIDREMLGCILEDAYEVYYAENGQQVIDLLAAGDRRYRLMLLDLMMPVVDGYGVLSYMKENDLLDSVPVMIITADGEKHAVLRAYAMGAIDVYQKPYVGEVVRNRVDNLLKLYGMGDLDSLTGGYNRSAFIKETEALLKGAEDPTEYAILFFNIKDFKAMNELFGAEGGDKLLKDFYNEILNSPTQPPIISRLEADRFVCVARKDRINLDEIAERMEKSLWVHDKKIRMFARFGVYYVESADIPVSVMIDRARLAKLNIVDESVQPYAVYDTYMKNHYVDQAEALQEFESGIENEEFQIYYQPVIEATTGKLASAEALVRWIHPKKGFVSPGSFIPALEKHGYITRLDRYIIEHVRQRLRCREEEGIPIIPVSVNLSWMDFYDESMMTDLVRLIDEQEISRNRIRLEVTETSGAALTEDRVNIIECLRKDGAVFLLDDFGSGYASLGMLESYNFDILKIDMSLVRRIEANEKSRVIVKSIIDLCHSMGMKTIAEGVETEEQVNILRESGCDFLQGYYYSKPISGKEFAEYVMNSEIMER